MMSSALDSPKALGTLFSSLGLHFPAAPAQPGFLLFSQCSNSIPRHSDILEFQEEHELPSCSVVS